MFLKFAACVLLDDGISPQQGKLISRLSSLFVCRTVQEKRKQQPPALIRSNTPNRIDSFNHPGL